MDIGWTFLTNSVPLAVAIGGLIWVTKRAFPGWFTHPVGAKLLMYAPFILGVGLGFVAMALEGNKTPVTTGLAAGAVAHLAYKAFKEHGKRQISSGCTSGNCNESDNLPHKLE